MRLFREAYPDINGAYAAYVEVFFRKPTMDYVLKKAALSEAPVYNYLFAPERPMNGGMIATHCGDIPFVFGNAEMIPGWQIPGVSGRLSKEFSRMAACFAKTGNPNIPEIPKWKPCTGKTIETMVIGSNWTPRSNHDRELVSFIEEHSPKHVPGFQHNYEPATVWNY